MTEPEGTYWLPYAGMTREETWRCLMLGEEWIASPILCDVPRVVVHRIGPVLVRESPSDATSATRPCAHPVLDV